MLLNKQPYEKTEKWLKSWIIRQGIGYCWRPQSQKKEGVRCHEKITWIFHIEIVSIQTKIKQFKMYVEIVLMYNTEMWTATKTINKTNYSFHRWLRRHAINKMWPKRLYTNVEIYNVTNSQPWSKTITRRRLNFTGHLLRLDEENTCSTHTKWVLQASPKETRSTTHNLVIMRQKRS